MPLLLVFHPLLLVFVEVIVVILVCKQYFSLLWPTSSLVSQSPSMAFLVSTFYVFLLSFSLSPSLLVNQWPNMTSSSIYYYVVSFLSTPLFLVLPLLFLISLSPNKTFFSIYLICLSSLSLSLSPPSPHPRSYLGHSVTLCSLF